MAISLREVASRVNSSTPIGTIVAFYGNTAPDTWLICDGRSCVGTELAKTMGITNVPDLRGRFIRMIGGNAAAMGVAQGDAIRNITGSTRLHGAGDSSIYAGCTGAFVGQYRNSRAFQGGEWYNGGSNSLTFDASKVVPTANENRPVNMAFNFIIKANNSLRIISNFITKIFTNSSLPLSKKEVISHVC